MIMAFFMSLKSFLNLNVQNELALLIWTSEAQVMAKRRAGSQIANLTPDHKKSRINPIYLTTGGVRHTVGKLWTGATTFLETALRSKVCSQGYGVPKLQESQST